MDHTRIAWQKSIWVTLTLEGDRKKLITPSQRTASGLACRNIFNSQFVQLLEDFDTYGPHKGFFVPRLEPSAKSEVAFEVHWDKLSDVLQEPGTASVPVVHKPVETEATLNSILESHNQRKEQKLTTDHSDESASHFAENRCITSGQALSPISGQETTSDLTLIEFYTQAKVEYDRRVGLAKRERIGLLEKSPSGIPVSLVGMKKVLNDLDNQMVRMKNFLRTQCQEQLQDTESREKESEDIIDALNWVEGTRVQIVLARSLLGGRSFDSLQFSYRYAVDYTGRVAETCTTVASREAKKAQKHDSAVDKSDGLHEISHDSKPPRTESHTPFADKLAENALLRSALNKLGETTEENVNPQLPSSPHQYSYPKKDISFDGHPGEDIEVDDASKAKPGVPPTDASAANATAKPAFVGLAPITAQPTECPKQTSTLDESEDTAPVATDDQAKFPGFGRDVRKDGTSGFRWSTPLAGMKMPIKWEGFW